MRNFLSVEDEKAPDADREKSGDEELLRQFVNWRERAVMGSGRSLLPVCVSSGSHRQANHRLKILREALSISIVPRVD